MNPTLTYFVASTSLNSTTAISASIDGFFDVNWVSRTSDVVLGYRQDGWCHKKTRHEDDITKDVEKQSRTPSPTFHHLLLLLLQLMNI